MKDFIHGALVKAASTDGIETMLKGAGIGAGANVGIGAVQGDFDVVGNSFSGAALGGLGGAAMKYGANRYAGNLMRQADGITEAGGKKVGMFTNPGENHALSFMGGDANTERFAKMAAAGDFNGKGYSTGAAAPVAGKGSEVVDTTPVSPKVSNNPSAQKRAPTRKTGESEDDFAKRKENFTSMQQSTPEAQKKIQERAANKAVPRFHKGGDIKAHPDPRKDVMGRKVSSQLSEWAGDKAHSDRLNLRAQDAAAGPRMREVAINNMNEITKSMHALTESRKNAPTLSDFLSKFGSRE